MPSFLVSDVGCTPKNKRGQSVAEIVRRRIDQCGMPSSGVRPNFYRLIARHIRRENSWRGSKWLSFDNKALLPELPGCYVIYVDGVLAYIGQAVNVRARINGHAWKFNNVWSGKRLLFKVRLGERVGDWAMREMRLLKRLKPPHNVVFGSMPPRKFNKAMGEF